MVVTNGICISHPCCGSHNCKVPLKNNRNHFCSIHADLEHVCLIVGCGLPVVSGWLTCADPLHQHVEAHHQDKGQSRFQLHDRLQCARDIHPSSHSANSRALSQLVSYPWILLSPTPDFRTWAMFPHPSLHSISALVLIVLVT